VAAEEGNKESVEKLAKQSVRVTKQHNDECKRLLRLMGVPVVEAPSEAEAQCAAIVKAGKAYATGTEDMDALTFGSPVMVRHLTFSEARKLPIIEINLARVLEGLRLTMDQFIDLCILCGCDYCDRIKGIGEKRAFELITKYGSLEKVLENLDKEKHPLPPNFPFDEIREIFRKPSVADPATLDLRWEDPDEAGLKAFLVGEKGFSEERVMRAIEKLRGAREGTVQRRIDSFFTPQGLTQSDTLKRKMAEADAAKGKKAKGAKGANKGTKGKAKPAAAGRK
jgi:flap endonuclease-1